MPIIKSAVKRVKQASAARERNVATKRAIKNAVKNFQAKPTSETLSAAHGEIDKALKKNLLHKNTAARRKSALAKVAKDAGVKLGAAKKSTTAKPAAAKKATAKTTTTAKKAPATKANTNAKTTKKPAAKSTTKTSKTAKK